jgi:hypothetical protein
MILTILGQARAEYLGTVEWYRDAGCADKFIDDVDESFRKIGRHPQAFPKIHNDIRK